jgi:hypothetical protein
MYAALWRVLPGPWFVKLLILLVAIAAILTACVFWVFPWVDTLVAPQDVVVTE